MSYISHTILSIGSCNPGSELIILDRFSLNGILTDMRFTLVQKKSVNSVSTYKTEIRWVTNFSVLGSTFRKMLQRTAMFGLEQYSQLEKGNFHNFHKQNINISPLIRPIQALIIINTNKMYVFKGLIG